MSLPAEDEFRKVRDGLKQKFNALISGRKRDRLMICSICKCNVTEPYRNPLGDGEITCWLHADSFYDAYPVRAEAARRKHVDIPKEMGII
jgi:hypothetical protein